MIQAVACGHSIGSVHEVNFPDVVSGAISSENIDGASHFDSTFDSFDNTGVLEYLHGTGLRGGVSLISTQKTYFLSVRELLIQEDQMSWSF